MASSTPPDQEDEKTKRENAKVGYQAAVDLWTYEGEQNWARFNVMLVANSVIIAAVTLVLTSENPLRLLSTVLAIVGLILCFAWFLVTKRGFDYQDYYILSARELEELFLYEPVQTAARGKLFAQGAEVPFELKGGPSRLRMSWPSRIASAGTVSQFVILLFVIVYIVVILQIAGRLPGL